jgi:hypothetical protein
MKMPALALIRRSQSSLRISVAFVFIRRSAHLQRADANVILSTSRFEFCRVAAFATWSQIIRLDSTLQDSGERVRLAHGSE